MVLAANFPFTSSRREHLRGFVFRIPVSFDNYIEGAFRYGGKAMTIEWNKLTPDERDRVVCELVWIEGINMFFVRTEGASIPFRGGFNAYKLAHDRIMQMPREPRYEIVEKTIFPKVSTDANEALKVLGALKNTVASVRHFEGGVSVRIRNLTAPPNGSVGILGKDICHAICIAALRAKGHEVIL